MNATWRKNGLVYLLIIVAVAVLFYSMSQSSERPAERNLSEIASLIKEGKVSKVVVSGDQIQVTTTDKQSFVAQKEDNVNLTSTLAKMGVTAEMLSNIEFKVAPPTDMGGWLTIVGTVLPLVLIGGLFLMIMRQAQGSNSQAMSFGKSKARVFTGDKPTVTFQDVAGAEESKQELQEVVEFLKEPQKFASLGARIPKGVLLVGPPGTGKTLMAKAISGEAGVPFFSISGSEFVEMFVGVGASRVRDLFEQAKRNSPCIIFIDEIDAVGRQRGAGLGGSHDEREQTLNQILVEMDGFDTDTNVILIAATNRPDILDPALLRPGRFDRQVVMDRPDAKGREAILKVHVKGKPLEPEINLATIAKGTPGFVGADIENLVNEAAILAARRNKRAIGMPEFQEAVERVVAGPERRSRIISDREKEIIAYHEVGHALVRRMLPKCDPGPQDQHHQPGHGAGLHHGAARKRPGAGEPHQVRARPERDARRPGCRADHLQRRHQRRRGRPGQGHQAGARDGHAVRHEREDGADGVRPAAGDDLPGPRDRRAAQLQRAGGAGDRQRGQPHRHRGLRPRQGRS